MKNIITSLIITACIVVLVGVSAYYISVVARELVSTSYYMEECR